VSEQLRLGKKSHYYSDIPCRNIGTDKRVRCIKQHGWCRRYCYQTTTTVVLTAVTQTGKYKFICNALRNVYMTVYQAFRFSQSANAQRTQKEDK